MTEQEITEIAIKEWENLHEGSYPYIVGIEWEYWLKAFQVALNKYRYTGLDMMAAFYEGAAQYCNGSHMDIGDFTKSNDAMFIKWLRERDNEIRKQTK